MLGVVGELQKAEGVVHLLAHRLEDENILIGPSDYVPWQKDNKVCFLRIEGAMWGAAQAVRQIAGERVEAA